MIVYQEQKTLPIFFRKSDTILVDEASKITGSKGLTMQGTSTLKD